MPTSNTCQAIVSEPATGPKFCQDVAWFLKVKILLTSTLLNKCYHNSSCLSNWYPAVTLCVTIYSIVLLFLRFTSNSSENAPHLLLVGIRDPAASPSQLQEGLPYRTSTSFCDVASSPEYIAQSQTPNIKSDWAQPTSSNYVVATYDTYMYCFTSNIRFSAESFCQCKVDGSMLSDPPRQIYGSRNPFTPPIGQNST